MNRAVRSLVVLAAATVALLLLSTSATAESPAILEVSLPKQLTTNPKFERNPSFFRATDGTWWVFFARGRGDPTAPGYNPDTDYYDICYVKSTDQGATWPTEGCLPTIPAGHGQGAFCPAAFQDGANKIWVFYAANGVGVFYFTSTNNGASWSALTTVPNVPGYVPRNHIEAMVAQNGRIWTFYQASPDDAIYGRNFNPATAAWSGIIWVSRPFTNAERPRAIQQTSTTFRVVYTAGTPRGIYLATSTDTGTTWNSPASPIADTANDDYDPVLVKDGTTWRLFFVPYIPPFPNDRAWLMTQSSTDLTNWTTPVTVTSGSWWTTTWWDTWPEAAVADGQLRLFYGSMKDGSQRGDGDILMFNVGWDLSRPHYEAIQPAIDAVASPDTINVAAGVYKENIRINKQVTLNGPNAGINPNTSSRIAEAVIVPESNDTAGGIIARVQAHNVTIDGFTLDGDNPDLSGGVSLNGIDANTYYGITNQGVRHDLIVRNNIVKNLFRGISLGASDAATSSDNHIVNNKFDNMPSSSPFGHGILIQDNFFAEISGNVMTRAYIGIQTYDFRLSGSLALIGGNQIQSYRVGIWHNLHHSAASTFAIQNNTLTTVPGYGTSNVGLWLTAIRDSVGVTITNNNISGADTGVQGWDLRTSLGVTITGGTLEDNNRGVWLYNYANYPDFGIGPGSATSLLRVSGVTVRDSISVGVQVEDVSPGGTNDLQLDVQDETAINGSPSGALAEGSQASLNISASALTGNTTAVEVSGGTATVTATFVTGNANGVLVRTGTATVNFSNLSGNSGLAVNHLMGTVTNASANWWGTNLQAGILAKVGTSVDYTPWLQVGTDTQPATPGFQPDLSVLNVDDNSPQSGGTGRIQEAINIVAGSTVNVAPGTYNETITFGAGFNKNNLTILGDPLNRPVVTGGVRMAMSGPISGLTLRNLYIRGDGGSSRVINCTNTGANNNFTLDNCVVDGENVGGRHGLAGNNFGQNFAITNSEFKDILGTTVMDINFGAGLGGADLPLDTVTFANNHVHDCSGIVALRGHTAAKTRQLNAYGNTFASINNDALWVNYALDANVYNNTARQLSGGYALCFAQNDGVDVHGNILTDNAGGIYFFANSSNLAGVEIHGNVICGNADRAVRSEAGNTGTADAEGNWWGTNSPGAALFQGSVDYVPWVTRNVSADPAVVTPATGSSVISAIYAPAAGYTVPDGHVVNWTTTLGTVNPITSTTTNGVATTVLTGNGTTGQATVRARDLCSTQTTLVNFVIAITPSPSPTAGTPTVTGTPPTPTPTPTPGQFTITIQRGTFGDSKDTYIYQYEPDTKYFAETLLKVGFKQQYASLLYFDLSPIPAGATILQAALHLYSTGWGGTDLTINAYAVLRDLTIRDATWNQAQVGNPWAVPGCNSTTTDRRGTPESSVATSGPGKWYSFNLTALVQQWLSGSLTNNGVMLRGSYSTAIFSFASNEGSTVSQRPKLVITYIGFAPGPTTPAPTATATPPGTPGAPTATPVATPSPTLGAGATITIQKGTFGDSEDTYIYQYDPDTAYRGSATLKVGYKQQYATLVRFDLSPIPPGATINQATLQMYSSGWSGSDLTLGAYAILRNVTIRDATWNQAQVGNPWDTPGCNAATDRRASPETSFATSGTRKWYSFNLTTLVQQWVNGSLTNNGVLLRADYSTATFTFASNEGTTVNLRPKLVVTYQ